MDNFVRQEAQAIAGMLDRGDVRDASFRLNQDLMQLSQSNPYATKEFLAATRAFEQGGGANLVLHHIRDQYGQIEPGRLAVGIACPERDAYGRIGYDVQDVGTVSVGNTRGLWQRPVQPDGWQQQQQMDWHVPPPLWPQNAGQANGWFTPQQRIWGQNTAPFMPGGVPYSNAQTFGLPGSRYAWPVTSSPDNYSLVGSGDYAYQGQSQPQIWDTGYTNYSTDTSYINPAVYAPTYPYSGLNSNPLTTGLAIGALSALSFGIGRRRRW